MQKLGVRGVPAVTEMGERRTLEFRPGEMQQLTSAGITPTAGDAGCIEKRGSMPIPQRLRRRAFERFNWWCMWPKTTRSGRRR